VLFLVLVLTVHKTLLIDWLTYVQNILQPFFVGPFEVVGPIGIVAYKNNPTRSDRQWLNVPSGLRAELIYNEVCGWFQILIKGMRAVKL